MVIAQMADQENIRQNIIEAIQVLFDIDANRLPHPSPTYRNMSPDRLSPRSSAPIRVLLCVIALPVKPDNKESGISDIRNGKKSSVQHSRQKHLHLIPEHPCLVPVRLHRFSIYLHRLL